jgi:hypothetical protein
MSSVVNYTDEQKHIAMLIWGFRANRNASETARMLSTDEYREHGLDGISRQSVAAWAREGNWAALINKELYREAPVQRFKTQAELILAAPEAARLLRDIQNLDPSLQTDYVVRNRDGEVVEVVKVFDEKVLKLRLEAAKVVLDRTGFSPVGTRDVGSLDTPPEMDMETDELSDEDWSDPYKVAAHHQREMAKLGIGVRQMESKQRKAERT